MVDRSCGGRRGEGRVHQVEARRPRCTATAAPGMGRQRTVGGPKHSKQHHSTHIVAEQIAGAHGMTAGARYGSAEPNLSQQPTSAACRCGRFTPSSAVRVRCPRRDPARLLRVTLSAREPLRRPQRGGGYSRRAAAQRRRRRFGRPRSCGGRFGRGDRTSSCCGTWTWRRCGRFGGCARIGRSASRPQPCSPSGCDANPSHMLRTALGGGVPVANTHLQPP